MLILSQTNGWPYCMRMLRLFGWLSLSTFGSVKCCEIIYQNSLGLFKIFSNEGHGCHCATGTFEVTNKKLSFFLCLCNAQHYGTSWNSPMDIVALIEASENDASLPFWACISVTRLVHWHLPPNSMVEVVK